MVKKQQAFLEAYRGCQKPDFGLEVRGILWIFDTFLRLEHITFKVAVEKLTQLLVINPRLPSRACNDRLEQWKKKMDHS